MQKADDNKLSGNKKIDDALHLDGDINHICHYYDDWAKSYDQDVSGEQYTCPAIFGELMDMVFADTVLARSKLRVLDAGCGTGLVGVELMRRGYCIIDGFDLSPQMVEIAEATGAYRQIKGAVDLLNADKVYASQSYDVIAVAGVFTLGHLPPQALSVLINLLANGAYLLTSTRSRYLQATDYEGYSQQLIQSNKLVLLHRLKEAPYISDDTADYWVYQLAG